MVAPVRVGNKRFGALRDPLNRSPDFFRAPSDNRLFGVVVDFRSEAAADIGGDDAQFVFRNVQHKRAHQQPNDMRVLARRAQRIAIARDIVFADGGARLEGVGDQAIVVNIERDDFVGAIERRVDFRFAAFVGANLPIEAQIIRAIGMRQLAAGEGFFHIDDRLLRIVIDCYCLARRLRLFERLGDDDRDRIADMRDAIDRDRRVRRLFHRRAVFRMNLPAARQTADAVGLHIRADKNGDDAGRGARRRRIDALDLRARVRRAHDVGVGLVRAIDVVRVSPAPGQKAEVLFALDRSADSMSVVVAHFRFLL